MFTNTIQNLAVKTFKASHQSNIKGMKYAGEAKRQLISADHDLKQLPESISCGALNIAGKWIKSAATSAVDSAKNAAKALISKDCAQTFEKAHKFFYKNI